MQFCAWSDMQSVWQGFCGGNNVMCVSSALRDTKRAEYDEVLSKICLYWTPKQWHAGPVFNGELRLQRLRMAVGRNDFPCFSDLFESCLELQ